MMRRIAGVTALAVALSFGVPPDAVPERGGWPLSGLLNMFRQASALAAVTGLPVQEWAGGAADRAHYVDANATRANGGAGRAPDRGKGVVDPALPTRPETKAFKTPGKPGDENSFDPATSKRLPKRSSPTYTEFENEDGSITRKIHNSRVNYQAADGSYQPIDTSLTKRGARLAAGANSIKVSVGASGAGEAGLPAAARSVAERLDSADAALAAVTTASGHTMAYDLVGAAAVPAVVNGSVATYSEILPHTDLELRSMNDGLKETIVLKSPAAGNEWVFPLKLDGLTASMQKDGSIHLLDPSGAVAMRVPPGFMEDSNVDRRSGVPAQSSNVKYELVTVDGGPALKVTADAAWLNDPARRYPVRVDPTTQTADTSDVFVDNSSTTTEQSGNNLPVGTWNGSTVSRSFLSFGQFDDDHLVGTHITDAHLVLWHTYSFNCTDHEPFYVRRITSPWSTSTLRANAGLADGPSYSAPIGTGLITNNYPACENKNSDRSIGAWRSVELDPTTLNGWSLGTIANYGLALTASETNTSAFKRFTSAGYGDYTDPYLQVTYDYNVDPQVNEQYPAYGATAARLTPELIADAHDPDNWPKSMMYSFIVYAQDAKTVLTTSGWITKKSWTVPAGKLKWGESYYWTVVVTDGLASNGSYATKHLLTTPVPQPSITSGLSQNSAQGFDPAIGNYTTSARDAMITTVGPPLEVVRSYNSIDPRSDQAFGAGWSSVVDAKAVAKGPIVDGKIVPDVVVVTYPNGREMAFGRNADNTYSSPAGRAATFSAITGGFKLSEKDGTTYEFAKETVAGTYAISAIKDASGRELRFDYADTQLVKITAASGRALHLTWTATTPKRVATVSTDPAVPGDATTVNTWRYDYTDGALTKVCPPTSQTECHAYRYEATRSAYPSAMSNARPYSYWRLTETSGTRAESSVLENGGVDVGTYSGVALGQPGPLAGSTATAAGFNGTSAALQLPANLVTDAANQAISMWFKTPGGDGVLYGQSAHPIALGDPATTLYGYNPTLYIGADGKLMGGFPKAPKLGNALGSLLGPGVAQCLSVSGNSGNSGTAMVMASCSGAANQQFTWTSWRELRVTSGGAEKCLDASALEVNAAVVFNTCDAGRDNQVWTVQADGQISNDSSGLCLDLAGNTGAVGAAVLLGSCNRKLPTDQLFLPRMHTAMQSPTTVADNKWHHVVLSAAGNRQELYLDGKLVSAEAGVTVQEMGAVRSYIGKGFLGGGWPNQSHANAASNIGARDYFTGSVAEVALFDTAVDKQMVEGLWGAGNSVKALTKVLRPSGGATATVGYDGVTGRVAQVTDGNGSVWRPEPPKLAGTTKVHESAVLGGAPTNYWRMADSGVSQAVNQVNGGTATYHKLTLGSADGPFGAAGKAATFDGATSFVQMPAGVAPSGKSSLSMWFQTTSTNAVLAGTQLVTSQTRWDRPTLWIAGDGKLRALSPSTTPTGPLNSGVAGKCLDVDRGGTANGTRVQSYACNGGAQQNWTLVPTAPNSGVFTVQANGKCLHPNASAQAPGTLLVLWDCNGSTAMHWKPQNGGLLNVNSKLCLDLPQQSTVDGTDVELYTCNASAAQIWTPSLTSKAPVNDGKWHHAVLTTNGANQTLYVDGVKMQSSDGTRQMTPDSTANYLIGTGFVDTAGNFFRLINSTAHTYFKGNIAEVATYASEIDANQASYQFKARAVAASRPSGEIDYTIIGPDDAKTTAVHDLTYGRKVADVDPLGHATRFGYSGKGNLRTVTDANGNMTINEHDVRGNVVAVTTCQDRSENKCSTAYSSFYPDATTLNPPANVLNDRLIEQRGAGSTSASDNKYLTRYTYDAQGNRTSETDPLGRTTTIAYTAVGSANGAYDKVSTKPGLPWRIVKPGGGVQTILYYPNGDVAQTTDPAGAITRYEYDALGRTVKEIDVENGMPGSTTSYAHDRLDRVVTVTDAAVTNAVSGAKHTPVTTLTYNPDGLLTSETVSDATGGDASRKVEYGYDLNGRRISETDALGNKVELAYDAYGRVVRQTNADGSAVLTKYDAVGNELATVVENWDPTATDPEKKHLPVRSLAYDPGGRLDSETDAMGWVNKFAYTDNNLIATVTRHNPNTGESHVLESNAYDTAGNLVTQITNNGLTKTTRTYDAVGRSLTATVEVSEVGEPTTVRKTTYEYSPEDDLVRSTLSDGSTVLADSHGMHDRLGRPKQQTTYLSSGLTPMMRWKMDHTLGATAADSAGNNAGTTSGAVTWSTERGGAASFAGSAAAAILGRPPVDTQRAYTLSAWAKLAVKDTDRYVAAMSGDIGNSVLKVFYDKETDSWQMTMAVRKSDGTVSWLASTHTAGSATLDWQHLAVVVTPAPPGGASTAQLHVGGVVKATISTTEQFNNQAVELRVGAETGAATGAFAGLIDDVQAYQKGLSAAEIGQLIAGTLPATDARVSQTTYGLAKDGSVTSVTDPNGNTSYITNDEVGRPTVTTTPAVRTVVGEGVPQTLVSTTRVGYNTFGEVTEQQDPNNGITVNRYDALGRMVESESPKYRAPGSSSDIVAKKTVEYNNVGQVIATTDPLGATTKYGYDKLGRTVQIVAPDNGVTKYEYDLNGELLSHTDPNGAKAASTYDYLGRTLTSTSAVRQDGTGHTTGYIYGTSPWPTSVKSATGVVTQAKYNGVGEITEVTDGAGNVTKTKYDGAGRPVRITAPDGGYVTSFYDFGGRAIGTTEHSATGTQLREAWNAYDPAGNTVATRDPRGTVKNFAYDALGQLVAQHEPISGSDSITSQFGYDLAGRQTRFTDGRGSNFITTYNSWGLPESQIEPATDATPNAADRTFTFSYDAAGRMTKVQSPGGVTAESRYDVMGRLTRVSGSGAQVATTDKEFTYDLVGRMTSFTGSAGTNTIGYDDRGLVTSIEGVSGASSYTYNADGALTSRTDGAGTTSYGYDTAGRAKTVTNTAAGVSMTYGYNNLNQVTSINYGGNVRKLGYNALRQLTTDELQTSTGASIAKIAYEWNANDSLTKKTTTGLNGASTNTYTYDLADRLIGWDNGVTPTVYAYDKSGNRVQAGSKTFTYDARNQLVSDSSGTTYQYTARGTLAAAISGGRTVETHTDAFNQVITQGVRSGGGFSTYTYDGLGRVIQAGMTYTGLGNDIAADGAVKYVRDLAGDLVGVSSGSGNRYAWTDTHTDVVGEFTATGTALTGSVSYDPWGKVLAAGGMIGKLGYQQEWTDQTTGKVNMWSRWYDPETGAFDTRDTANNSPSPTSGSANKFAYGEGDPMSNTDTTGNAVDGKCGQYDYACEVKKYQAALKIYNDTMAQRDRDMKAIGSEIAAQEAEYQRASAESQTSLLDILLDVGIGMLLDMIGYNSLMGCLDGSIWDCVDLATNVLGPIKAFKMGKSLYRAAERAFSGYKTWKRIVEGAQTAMRRSQDLINAARKHLNDVMSKVPVKPKPPKKKVKPKPKKKPKPKPKAEKKPKPSKQAEKPKPKTKADKQDKPAKAKPQQAKPQNKQPKQKDAREERGQEPEAQQTGDESPDTNAGGPSCAVMAPKHSFNPSTLVLMADGSTRPISEINIGDEVVATDPVTGEEGARKVTVLHSNRDLELTDVTVSEQPADKAAAKPVNEGKGDRSTRGPTESVLETTAHHPFWDATTGAWVDAAKLVAGESTLVGPDGQIQYVTAVRNFTGSEVMRDLTVDDIHTYYVIAGAKPVLVHNNNCPTPDERAHARASENAAYSTRPGNSTSASGATGGYLWIKGHGTFDLSSDKLHPLIKANMGEIPAEAIPEPGKFFGSHVEVQAATLMRILAKQADPGASRMEARLMVSKPGGPCSFCLGNVAGMLPKDSALAVRSQLRQVFSEELFEN